VDLILKDWDLIVQEIKDFEELARCYKDFPSPDFLIGFNF